MKQEERVEEAIYLMHEQEAEVLKVREQLQEKENMKVEPEEGREEPVKAKPYPLNEIREKRGENFRVHRMSDQTERAEFYPDMIHVFDDETERFEDVQNTYLALQIMEINFR